MQAAKEAQEKIEAGTLTGPLAGVPVAGVPALRRRTGQLQQFRAANREHDRLLGSTHQPEETGTDCVSRTTAERKRICGGEPQYVLPGLSEPEHDTGMACLSAEKRVAGAGGADYRRDRKSTRLNSSH